MEPMIEGIIEADGRIRLLGSARLERGRRVAVTLLDTAGDDPADLPTLLSESALAADWNRPEEEEAWSHLQRGS